MIFFGFKGSGKTYYGRLFAKQKNLPFLDTDEMFYEMHKLTPAQFCIHHGEAKFRELEAEIVQSLTADTIISLGGGTILNPKNLHTLQKLERLIYLDCPFEMLRITTMPTFTTDLHKTYLERKPLYEAIPAVRIDTTQDVLGVLHAL